MLAALAFALFLGGSPQEPTTPKVDAAALLDQLVERSRAVKSFSATYRMTSSDDKLDASMRFDFEAPSRLRLEMTIEHNSLSTWVIGNVFEVRHDMRGEPETLRLDVGPIRTQLAPIKDALERAFPSASPVAGAGGVLVLHWSYDTNTDKIDFNPQLFAADEADSPFGWLSALKEKRPAFVADGEHLRCTTDDGHFDVVLSKTTGLLEQLTGRKTGSPVTTTMALESFTIDEPVDASRFQLPDSEEVRETPPEVAAQMADIERSRLRERIWGRATNACASATADAELRAKFEATMRPLHELMCHAQYDDWLASTRENTQKAADYLRQQSEAGSSHDEVEGLRVDARSKLIAILDKSETSRVASFATPSSAATAGCGPQLLDIERELAMSVFRDLVRQPLLDEFDRATKTD